MKDGNSQALKQHSFFSLKSTLEKTHPYSEQNREVLATSSLSPLLRITVSNVLAMSTL